MRFRFSLPLVLVFACILHTNAQNPELDSLENVLPLQDGKEKVSTLNSISWHYRQSNTARGMEMAKTALTLSEQLDYPEGLAVSLQSVGAIHEVTGAFDSALLYFTRALEFKKALGDSAEIAASFNGIGMVHDQLGRDESALVNYFDALRIYEQLDDASAQAMVLVNIGIVYKKQKEYAKVLDYYQKALAFYAQEGSVFGSSVVQGNIGAILIKLENYKDAINYSQRAFDGYKSLGYDRLMAYPLGNMAIAFDSLGQTSEARVYYLQALELHQKNNNTAEVAFNLKNLANNELKTGEISQAQGHALSAKKIAEEIKASDILMQSLVILVRCEMARGNFQSAFVYQRQYDQLRDRAFAEEKTKAIFELETKYETQKKDRELERQRLALVEKDLEIQKSRITQIMLVGAVLLLIVVGLLIRARIKLAYQKKLEQEKLLKQEELLRAVISSVEGERKRFSEDLHDSFGQLISVLKMNVDSLSAAGNATSSDRQQVFEQSVGVLNDMYGELKNVCFNLMPKTLIQHGLPAAIGELTSRINSTGKIRCQSSFYDLEDRLADIQEISLYRIAQEWTNNVLKYSNATDISVQITRDEQEITLTIEDDGMGFDQATLKAGKGNGWKNLQSRTNLMKGTLELETTPGRKGTMLIVNVPAMLKHEERKSEQEKAESLLTYALF